jgi:hypothetical protein
MATGKINSNTVDAQAAIAELVGLNANSFANQSVDFGKQCSKYACRSGLS